MPLAITHRPRLQRVVLAFIAAPVGSAAVVAVVFVATGLGESLELAATIAAFGFALTAIIGYAVAVILGIPGYLFLRHRGWVRRAHWVLLCTALGGVGGAIWPAMGLVTAPPFGSLSLYTAVVGGFVFTGALLGAVAGLVFSLVIKQDPPRPDEIAATFD
jgi:hypothetical protein